MNDKYSINSLNIALNSIEDDGYLFITKIEEYLDRNIAVIEVHGKDPLMSSVSKFKVDVDSLVTMYDKFKNRVNHNFNIIDGILSLPNCMGVEKYSYTSTSNLCEDYKVTRHTMKTPVEVLWELVCGDYRFIWDGCGCVKCSSVYFGSDNFSISVDKVDSSGVRNKIDIIKYVNGRYKYTDMLVVPNDEIEYNMNPQSLFGDVEYVDIVDDLGRVRHAFKLNLKRFESSMYNQDKFDKIYSREYSLAVIDKMYKIASYINGLCMILKDIGGNCNDMVLPCKSDSSFVIITGKQHNTFTMQNIHYSSKIVDEVKHVYLENVDTLNEYLRTKSKDVRDKIYDIFMNSIGNKFGDLTYYFVNGVLDALAIQKGDKKTRVQILSDYVNTVHKEFLMYGFYFYDLRTMFLRNNYRIEREFNNTLIINGYSGNYFRVG